MNEYEINIDTQAIIPIGPEKSKVIEGDKIFIVNQPALKIIDKSCRFFGSSYQGRFLGTKNLIGISHKAPIIIEETREIIFFPTNSPRQDNCAWISLRHLQNYKKLNNRSVLKFTGGHLINLDISYGTLDNQVLRATRLESVLRFRKSNE